ncbi:hypothetical protein BRARA_F01141 [Brassica rapa]|uniref:Uncharacterized protein n=1 Tax=Brassica campestris TaxID=3711 RepID=A0A397YWF7_BRACM|nr:hypothetical protein BRARA_F01141 [Brassica rapa]
MLLGTPNRAALSHFRLVRWQPALLQCEGLFLFSFRKSENRLIVTNASIHSLLQNRQVFLTLTHTLSVLKTVLYQSTKRLFATTFFHEI